MDDLEQRIREHAFHLWEQAGCPPDRADEFWAQAEAAERGPGTTQPAETDRDPDPAKFAGF
jgi:hypothetical protein